jgi:hypothetical protein
MAEYSTNYKKKFRWKFRNFGPEYRLLVTGEITKNLNLENIRSQLPKI